MAHCRGCHRFKWHDPPPGFDPLGWHRQRFPGYLEKVDLVLLSIPKQKIPLDRAGILFWLQKELERINRGGE